MSDLDYATIKPIETKYKGFRFRSRLEARWAVFFDQLGVKFEYEIEGFDLGESSWYLPDFWLPDHETWIEIKGHLDPKVIFRDFSKMETLHRQTKHRCILIAGNVGDHKCKSFGWSGFEKDGRYYKYNFMYFENSKYYIAIYACPNCQGLARIDSKCKDNKGNDTLHLSCHTCNAIWTLVFSDMFIYIEPNSLKIRSGNFAEYLAYIKHEDTAATHGYYERAITAARSARFEHGENGD